MTLDSIKERFKFDVISRLPIDAKEKRALGQANLSDILDMYLEYAARFVPERPRRIHYLPDFFSSKGAQDHVPEILEIEEAIKSGRDLSRYISRHAFTEVRRKTTERGISWKNRDFILNAYQMHHLHLGRAGGRNHYSDELLYVRFWPDDACLLFVGTHKSFHNGEAEQAAARVKALSGWDIRGIIAPQSYSPKENTQLALHGMSTLAVVDGVPVLSAWIASDGSSTFLRRHCDRIYHAIDEIMPKLSDPSEYNSWFDGALSGINSPAFEFHMDFLDLMLIERTRAVGIRVVPFRY